MNTFLPIDIRHIPSLRHIDTLTRDLLQLECFVAYWLTIISVRFLFQTLSAFVERSRELQVQTYHLKLHTEPFLFLFSIYPPTFPRLPLLCHCPTTTSPSLIVFLLSSGALLPPPSLDISVIVVLYSWLFYSATILTRWYLFD